MGREVVERWAEAAYERLPEEDVRAARGRGYERRRDAGWEQVYARTDELTDEVEAMAKRKEKPVEPARKSEAEIWSGRDPAGVGVETQKMLGMGGNAAKAALEDGKVLKAMRSHERLLQTWWSNRKRDLTAWRVIMACRMYETRQRFPENVRNGPNIGWTPYCSAVIGCNVNTAKRYVQIGDWIAHCWPDFHKRAVNARFPAGSDTDLEIRKKSVEAAVELVSEWRFGEGGPGTDSAPDTFTRYVKLAAKWREEQREAAASAEGKRKHALRQSIDDLASGSPGASEHGQAALGLGEPETRPDPPPGPGNGPEEHTADLRGGLSGHRPRRSARRAGAGRRRAPGPDRGQPRAGAGGGSPRGAGPCSRGRPQRRGRRLLRWQPAPGVRRGRDPLRPRGPEGLREGGEGRVLPRPRDSQGRGGSAACPGRTAAGVREGEPMTGKR